MIKKLLLMITPVLVLAAFSVMPAFAQAAETKEYGTCSETKTGETESASCPKAKETFHPFTVATNVTSKKATGTGNFILRDKVTGAVIECTSFSDKGVFTNAGGVGTSKDTLTFAGCSTKVGTLTCPVQTAGSGSGNIVVTATNTVLTDGTVQITVTAFTIVFTGPPPTGCPAAGTVVGKISGSVTGTQAAKTDILVFNKATGLKLGEDETELTGSNETVTEVGAKPVLIN